MLPLAAHGSLFICELALFIFERLIATGLKRTFGADAGKPAAHDETVRAAFTIGLPCRFLTMT